MTPLTDPELAAGSELGRRLVAAFRAARVQAPYEAEFTDRIRIRIPAVAQEVGGLEILDDRDEYTV